jgi:aminoglycoside phosphotransferase (APT) family kinase protein
VSWDWTPDALRGLEAFLGDRGILNGPLTTRRIGDGHSNLTFLVSDGDRQVIVRRPPPPPTPPGANDMLREAKILTALAHTAVPVPNVLTTSEAGEVLDVAFYVMSYVPGPIVTTATPAPFAAPDARDEVGKGLIDTLADLHAVDWRNAGLGDLGRPEGFNDRHLRRLARLVADDDGDPPPRFAPAYRWLSDNVPTESGASIVHCDYRIGNVVLGVDRPGRVAAVLDWELATLGDPLLDVGYFLATIPQPGRPMNPTAELGLAMLEDGYPTRTQLADRYAARTGRNLSDISWYTSLALWKLAVLYEYSGRRAATGGGDPYYLNPVLVPSFLEAAHVAAGIGAITKEPR